MYIYIYIGSSCGPFLAPAGSCLSSPPVPFAFTPFRASYAAAVATGNGAFDNTPAEAVEPVKAGVIVPTAVRAVVAGIGCGLSSGIRCAGGGGGGGNSISISSSGGGGSGSSSGRPAGLSVGNVCLVLEAIELPQHVAAFSRYRGWGCGDGG
jgi:hypothetical protein